MHTFGRKPGLTSRQKVLLNPFPSNSHRAQKHENYPRNAVLKTSRVREIKVDENTRGVAATSIIRAWSTVVPFEMNKVARVGGGAAGLVVSCPSRLARAVLANPATFGLTDGVVMGRRVTSNDQVVIKFQLIGHIADLEEAFEETIKHSIMQTEKRSTAPGIPAASKYVPSFYCGGYMPGYQMHVTFMERINGIPLEKITDRGGVVSPALQVELEKALASMWHRGFMHGDAHAGNFMVSGPSNLRVTIIDFGHAIVLPKSLRPTSLRQARSPEYLELLDAYVARSKEGYQWHNPNTRLLKVTRSLIPTDRYKLLTVIRRAANSASIPSPVRSNTSSGSSGSLGRNSSTSPMSVVRNVGRTKKRKASASPGWMTRSKPRPRG